jgi:TPR repeat protein
MYDEGMALKQDYSQAATLYSKACNEGDAEGCSDIGNLYRFGVGVAKDSAKAKELLKRSCDEGSQRGCARLKAM